MNVCMCDSMTSLECCLLEFAFQRFLQLEESVKQIKHQFYEDGVFLDGVLEFN